MKPYYDICPICKSHIDPGEKCDCQNNDKEVNEYDKATKNSDDET